MPKAPDSEIPFYSSSDEMRSRPFERGGRESVRTTDPLRAAHEFLFRGNTGGAGDTSSGLNEEEPVRRSGPWLIPIVAGCVILGAIIGYTVSSINHEKVRIVETNPGKIITTSQASDVYGTVIGTDVRVRRFPNLDAEITARANDGDRLKVRGEAISGWYPVEIPAYGETGYVFGAYIETENNKVLIARSNILIRTMPELSSPAIELIPNGSKVMAIPQHDNWYKTYLPDGRSGYINVNNEGRES